MKPCRILTASAARAVVVVAGLAVAAPPAAGQAHSPLDRALRVYFDCPNTYCDDAYLIERIPWVDFVRDRGVADVHVLVIEQSTGGGGEQYTLRFIGKGEFAGREKKLDDVVPAGATDDEERRALARVARVGLAGFASETPAAARMDVTFAADDDTTARASVDDPWNGWVFEVDVDTWLEGEDRYSARDVSGRVGASRVTEDWRFSMSVDGHNGTNDFVIDDTTTVVSRRESYGARSLLVRSLDDHWSVGSYGGWSRSTHSNYDASLHIAPAVEYSIFPYSESTSRLFTVLYAIGPRYYDYAERTIFGRTSEAVLHHFVAANFEAIQPWGSIDVTSSVTHLIMPLGDQEDWPDPQYSASIRGGVELSVFQGLSVGFDGGTEIVRNQIQLQAGELTEEEILTRQRELATGYRYWASLGLEYQFGSIFSPVVNRRLDYLD